MSTVRARTGPGHLERQRRYLRITLGVLIALTASVVVLYAARAWVDTPWNGRTASITAGAGVLYVVALGLEHRGRVRAAAWLLAAGTIIGSWLPVLVPGGIGGDRSYFFVAMNVLVVSLAVGARAGGIVAALDLAFITWLYAAGTAYTRSQFVEDVILMAVFAAVFVTLSWARERDGRGLLQAHARLEASLADTRAILESSQDAIVSVDTGWRVLVANPVAAAVARKRFGVDLEAGADVLPDLPASVRDAARRAFQAAMDSGSMQTEVEDPEEGRWWDVRIRAIETQDAPIGLAIQLRDTTAAREAAAREKDLLRERLELEKLREVDAFRTHLLNIASHELRTPLTPLRIQAALLRNHIDEIPERLHGGIRVLERNARRLAVLVGDLMDVSRLEAGRLSLQSEAVHVAAAVRHEVESFAADAEKRGITLAMESTGDPVVAADPDRLGQVLANLIANALKFTPPGGRVTVRAKQAADVAVLEVEDTGRGFDQAHASRIFEPFHQVEDVEKGSGLGLYICRGILDLHDGSIEAHSPGVGRGARFEVRLPLAAGRSREQGGDGRGRPQRAKHRQEEAVAREGARRPS